MGTNRGRIFSQRISFITAPFFLTQEQVEFIYNQALKMILDKLNRIEFNEGIMAGYMEYLPMGIFERPRNWAQALKAEINANQGYGTFEFVVFTSEYHIAPSELDGRAVVPRIVKLD